jgi:peptidoglycan/LPS O-acetylase OafA/YrhL
MIQKVGARQQPDKHLPTLDSFRALAALAVLFYHVQALLQIPSIASVGFMGVDVFFVLSGFLLVRPSAKSYFTGDKPPSLRQFYTNRVRRIMPLYYFSIAVVLLMQRTDLLSFSAGQSSVLTFLAFVQNMFPHYGSPVNGVLWSLGVEMQFYLLLPALAWFLLRPKTRFIAIIVVLLVAGVWRLASVSISQMMYPKATPETVITYSQLINSEFLPGRIDQLVIGILAGIVLVYLEHRSADKPLPTRFLSFSMYIAAIVVVLNIFWLYIDGDHIWQSQYLIFYLLRPLFAASIGVLFVTSCILPARFTGLLRLNVFNFLASISYGIYIWHLLFLRNFISARFFETLPKDTKFIAMLILLVTVVIIWSTITYVAIERPFLRTRVSEVRPDVWTPVSSHHERGSPQSMKTNY